MKMNMINHVKIYTVLMIALLVTPLSGCGRDDEDRSVAAPVPEPAQKPVVTIEDDRESAITDGFEDDNTETDDTEVSDENANVPDPADSFYAEKISDEIFSRMEGKSFAEGCTTDRDDLRYLHLLYKDLEGNTHEGEMVCNVSIADKLIDIFRQLYENDYPIESMKLIDEYDADDEASMRDNNTSCFNFRVVSGTDKVSKHGYGLAVDLNPFYNPYVHKIEGRELIEPEGSAEYADRSRDFDYKIDEDDLAYKLFTQAGFTWGGSWKNSKDYQHFQM